MLFVCGKEHRCQSAEHCFILGPVVRQSPLGKTRTVFDQVSGKSVKVPEGKICLICLNVFKLLGHMAKHGSYAEYYKKVVQHLCQES